MKIIKKYTYYYFFLLVTLVMMSISSCQKQDDYYMDTGLANPYFEGTIMDYMKAQPFYFDSIALVAKLAGMDSLLRTDTVTFFAPTDRTILRLIKETNEELYKLRYDTIKTLQDVPDNIWRKFLSRYIFHGANQLKDYPQIDYDLRVNYPGQGYLSWDGTAMNIGVIYHNDNGVKYVGYRQLTIAFIPDVSNPTANWRVSYVASSNILTDNGVVHVLSDGLTLIMENGEIQISNSSYPYFGFDLAEFVSDMETVMGRGGNIK